MRREVIELVDDLDGGPATGTVTFALDGTTYEIDLNQDNQEQLHSVLERWTGPARKTSASRRTSRSNNAGAPTAAEIRTWASSAGHELSSHGRIPQEIRAAYDAAH